jgi:F0F1-type ATP synthase membrane subunit b/b'
MVQESLKPTINDMENIIQEYRERINQALEIEIDKLKEKAERESNQLIAKAREEAGKLITQAREEAREEADRVTHCSREAGGQSRIRTYHLRGQTGSRANGKRVS